jgi:hypothetical protein
MLYLLFPLALLYFLELVTTKIDQRFFSWHLSKKREKQKSQDTKEKKEDAATVIKINNLSHVEISPFF